MNSMRDIDNKYTDDPTVLYNGSYEIDEDFADYIRIGNTGEGLKAVRLG